mmetsp:Transcript_16387/g.24577  ORF Transcript_16387/g.24577 Transcript_16387/m.24577 type:complete len:137 (-) Transcript_16387:196-606(-)
MDSRNLLVSGRRLIRQAFGVDGFRAVVGLATILPIRNLANFVFSHQIPEADLAQKLMNLIAQIRPEVVGQAFLAILAIAFIATPGSVQRFADGIDNFGDVQICRRTTEPVTTTGATNADNQFLAAETGEKLFQVGQ